MDLEAVRAANPGAEVIRYADGRITRNGVDLSQAEIDAAIAAHRPTHDALEAARAAEEAANANAQGVFGSTPADAEAAVQAANNNVVALRETVAALVRVLKAKEVI